MFTGIVEEKGKVRYMQLNGESGVLAVKAKKVLEGTKTGDSIAVNGVCLTALLLRSLQDNKSLLHNLQSPVLPHLHNNVPG